MSLSFTSSLIVLMESSARIILTWICVSCDDGGDVSSSLRRGDDGGDVTSSLLRWLLELFLGRITVLSWRAKRIS